MKKIYIIFFLILIFAAFFRIYKLSTLPPSLNWDEVSHGYNAYSILTTGRDEWGQRFPLTAFKAYGDYKLPLYIYLTAPLTLFGLNEWTVRLVSSFSGIGVVFFTFFLVQRLFKNYQLSLLSTLLIAVSPWHILLSRAAFEANLALFLIIVATWLFLKGFEKKAYFPASFFVFGLSFYAYNSAKIFVPILVFVLIILYKKQFLEKMKIALLSVIIFISLLLPHLVLLSTSEGQARFYWSTILDQGAINQINQERTTSDLPSILPILFHNKPVFFSTKFISNWLSYYSPAYLFTKGGSNYQYSIPGWGVMNIAEAPFLLIGLFTLFLLRKRNAFLILIWFAFGTIAASVTRDSPNVLRSILILPAPQIISAFGLVKVLSFASKFGRRYYFIFLGLFVLLLSYFFCSFIKDYFGSYRNTYSSAWQYGYKEVSEYIKSNYDEYDKIIVTKKYGEPNEFLLFYLKWSPDKYQKDKNLIRYYRSNWYWVDQFDKLYFVNDWEVIEKSSLFKDEKTLLVSSPDNAPQEARKLKTINFLNGEKAFEIFEL